MIFLTCLRFHGKNSITIDKSCEISKYTFQKALLFCSCCSIIIGLLFSSWKCTNILLFKFFFTKKEGKKLSTWNCFYVFSSYYTLSCRPPTGDSLLRGPPLLLESVLWFCDKGEVLWWSPPPVRAGSGGIRPSFMRFFCFIRLFWNHIFTWVSLSCRAPAISILRALVRYLLKWNSFSNSVNCLVVKLVLPVLLMPPGLGWPP